jgi:hypothetical protein
VQRRRRDAIERVVQEDLLVGGSAKGAHLRSDLGAIKPLGPGQVCLVTTSGQYHC